MVFVNNRNFLFLSFVTMSTLVLTSCVTGEKQPERLLESAVKVESRASLLNWYDVTHKSYYGLKGAVKSLVIDPAILISDSRQAVNEGWILLFNEQGRLTSKETLAENDKLKTLYTYSEKGLLDIVSSYRADQLWRSSYFIYEGDQLVKIQFTDKKANEQFEAKVEKQKIPGGWFEMQKAINSPGLPSYSKFLQDNSLVWSNKGDINNGLGELYFIRTVDGVTSSDVLDAGTGSMREMGGYKYVYQEDGLLKAVESYNAHKNRLFHRTTYTYNDLALLRSEQRKVFDESPFNKAVEENINYDYLDIDKRGNWLKRNLTSKTKYQEQSYMETRKITYY